MTSKPIPILRAAAAATLTCALLLASTSGTAWAKDSLIVDAKPPAGDSVAVVNNGQANGTIQLFYTVNAPQFPTGYFATFDLNWIIAQGRQATSYGTGVQFELKQDQQGGHVELDPVPASFTLTHGGQSGTSKISIFITPDEKGKLPPSADGTDLVGNLKLDAGSAVNSVTSIQVHIRLVHPTNCLRVYNFVTDQEFNLGILDTADVKVGTSGAKKGLVVSSNPGQFSDNVLIANACAEDHSFDLGVGLGPSFSINATGNPVGTYTAAGQFDTSNFGAILLGAKTPRGQSLCLENVTVTAGASLLVTVHAEVTKNAPAASLPASRTFDFAAALFDGVNTGCSGPLSSATAPNPAVFALPFTVNGN